LIQIKSSMDTFVDWLAIGFIVGAPILSGFILAQL